MKEKVKIQGDHNFEVEVIADSVSESGKRISTFVLTYPRAILAEMNTHRVFSRNSMSSRAIPVHKMIEYVNEDQYKVSPVYWGKNQSGMKAKEECDNPVHIDLSWLVDGLEYTVNRHEAWQDGRKFACSVAKGFADAEYHKQSVNRIIEPYQMMRSVVTSTSFDNFFWLRDHKDAQPEIQHLAKLMKQAYDKSQPTTLHESEWHVPFYKSGIWSPHYELETGVEADKHGMTLDDALKVSTSCCAQASFRNSDDSVDKAHRLYKMLIESSPAHSSPAEHQAKPMHKSEIKKLSELKGVQGATHVDTQGRVWSGNFCGWVQHRQLIHNELGYKLMTGEPE